MGKDGTRMALSWKIIIVLLVIFAFLLGYVLGSRSLNKGADGAFVVDMTDPEKDVFRIELNCPIGSIPTKKKMIFTVENRSSQEKPFA